MGIPTGPQQGGNTGRGGLPTGNGQGGQNPAPQRQRPGGLPQPTRPAEGSQPARRESGLPGIGSEESRPVQQRPSSAPTGNRQQPRQQPQAPQQPVRQQAQRPPARAPQQALPEAPDEQFDDPFGGFDSEQEDLFSDVPRSYTERVADDDSGFDDDDPFSQDAAGVDSEDDEEEIYEPEPEIRKAPRAAPAAKPRRLSGATKAPQKAKAASEDYEEEFVDKENLKLKPFGKPKKKAKVGDFDPRKNLEGRGRLYRGIFLTAIVVVVGFGAYQTFWPQQSLSVSEVQNIAALQSGETGFPTTRGQGFALSFMDSLLNIEPDSADESKRNAALSYFFGTDGDASTQSFSESVNAVGNLSQQVVYGPVILDSTALTANAASYEVGLLMSTSAKGAPEDDNDPATASDKLRWVAFNVNVYYDAKKDSFAIAPNSPSLLPAPAVESPSTVPEGEPLGEAKDDYSESVKAVVVGFLEGYRESTKDSTDKIFQYIGSDADKSLKDGLGGRYQFSKPDDPASSIQMEVYQPGASANELKILLTVDWQIAVDGESSVTFPSHYVMTLTSKGGGDYKVTKFAPYYWTEATNPDQ